MIRLQRWQFVPFILLICLAGCNKKVGQHDFVIICKTPPLGGMYAPSDDADLVVTDAEGHVLGAFDIGANEAEFQRTLKVDEDIKTCNIHLGHWPGSGPAFIYSHLDVQSGSLVVFEPSRFVGTGSQIKQKVVRVEGIKSLDSLGFLGSEWPQLSGFEQPIASISTFFHTNQGALLHGKANGEADYRYLYLPHQVMASFDWDFYVHWDQFKPVPAPRTVVTSSTLPIVQEMFVDAISPDFQYFVNIGPGKNMYPTNLQFIQPEEVPRNLRIRLNGPNYATERIFQPGEPLQFDMTDMRIGNISWTQGEKYKIETSGDIDMLEVTRVESPYYIWKITGKPSSFRDLSMPTIDALDPFIPIPSSPTPFGRGTVKAHQFGKHDYPQAKEGFPFRSTEPFALARSGYFMIEKPF